MTFLTGVLTNTMLKVLISSLMEVLKGILFQIGWKVVLERFATRLILWGLTTLKKLSTNDVVDETIEDVMASLRGKRLKEVPDKQEV